MIFGREYHERFTHSRFYPFTLSLAAFFLMISGLVPFEVVLIPAVAATPGRWKKICFSAAMGSALGAVGVASFFRVVGWPWLAQIFPSLGASPGWVTTQNWIDHYGSWALIAIASLPIAQAPALALAGLLQISTASVLAAFILGKSVKYSVISLLVIRGERRFEKRISFLSKSI